MYRELDAAIGMIPVCFGPPALASFGMYTPARPLAPTNMVRGCAVLLCPALGWQGFVSRRAYRVLADTLAAAGFAVLRFDYPGTGDSAGTELDGDRVGAWLASIENAADELRERARVSALSVVGLHVGGTLAAASALQSRSSGKPVSSLVLWAAPPSAKHYLRQVRAHLLLRGERVPDEAADLDYSGFTLTAETRRELARLDVRATQAPCARVLVVGEDQTSAERQAKELALLGARADARSASGYAALMQEPRKSVLPLEAIELITEWMTNEHPGLQPLREGASASVPVALSGLPHTIAEHASFVGPERALFAITSTPTQPPPSPRPLVLCLNTAADPHIGPHRMFVPLLRRLASLGFRGVRFDPRGVGDSAGVLAADDTHGYSPRRIAENAAVLAWLAAEHGAAQVALLGVCSAAYAAFELAKHDPRVRAIALISPQTLAWKEGDTVELRARPGSRALPFYRRRVFVLATWRRLARGDVGMLRIAGSLALKLARRARRTLGRKLRGDLGASSAIAKQLRTLLDRGVDVLIVLGDEDASLDYIEGELGPMAASLAAHPNFRLEFVPRANHTFSQPWAQRRLAELIEARLLRRFSRDAPQT